MWRFINTGFMSGPENMAIDEALLNCFEKNSLPILRFYKWQPASISIGRFQTVNDALLTDKCKIQNLPIVRRITGGGLIYHYEELTYSIICKQEHLGKISGLPASYKKICSFLIEFYKTLGLNADYAMNCKSGKLGIREQFCFAGNEQYDIIIDDRKIGGNAQRRVKDIIFQHGSIPVESQIENVKPFLVKTPPNLIISSTHLRALGIGLNFEEMFELMKDAFKTAFNIEFIKEGLTDREKKEKDRLLDEKYLSDEWNLNSGRQKS